MTLPKTLTTVTSYSKILAVLFFFAFILAGFLAGMQYQYLLDYTSQQETSFKAQQINSHPILKTYSSKTYTFQYPSGFAVAVSNYGAVTVGSYGQASDFVYPGVMIYGDITTSKSLNEFYQERYMQGENKQLFHADKNQPKHITVSGVDALEITDAQDGVSKAVVIVYKGKGYDIGGEKMSQKDLMLYDQILSTLQFLNQTASITPTCIPRPSCLDSTPRCMIAESTNMCPKTK